MERPATSTPGDLMDEPLVEAALAYAAAGIPVLPLHHPPLGGDRWPGRRRAIRCSCDRLYCLRAGEHPLSPGGVDAASTEPAAIQAWWRRHPDANIGLATGVRFDVLDVDAGTGPLALARLESQAVPVGPVVRTGSGRWQLFTVPSGQPSRVLWGPSPRRVVRWHGRGGFVVAPPSRHAGGALTRWVRPLTSPCRHSGRWCMSCSPRATPMVSPDQPGAVTAIRGRTLFQKTL
jgi:Bifunctional DNA primase/polymerase, N-terminal